MSHNKPKIPTINQVESRDDAVELNLYLDEDLYYFDGHFPNAPLVAGVVQLDWAVNFAKRYLNMQGEVKSVEVLKFQVVMPPKLAVRLSLTRKSEHKFTFSYASEKGQHASGRIVLEPSN